MTPDEDEGAKVQERKEEEETRDLGERTFAVPVDGGFSGCTLHHQ